MNRTLTQEEKLAIIEANGGRPENILNILLALQDASAGGYIDQETSATVAACLGMTETKVFEIASFYAMVNTAPQAAYVLEVCNSAPCHISKSDVVASWVADELAVGPNVATADGLFSYRFTPCVGACDIGPVIKVGDDVYGDLTPEKVKALIQGLRENAGR